MAPPIGPTLPSGEVHIWKLTPQPDADLEQYSRILSQEERDRAARFRFPHLSRSFTLDHGRMRLILAAYAGLDPESLIFTTNKYGKPELANPKASESPERLRFNLSHTAGLTLLALCRDADLGVDVEAVRAMNDLEFIAESHFSPREITALRASAAPDKERAFFRCWTRKEALLKAHGRGLSIPLDSFAVSLAEEPELLECHWDENEVRRWSMFSFDLGPCLAAALAIQRGDWRIVWFDWAGTLK